MKTNIEWSCKMEVGHRLNSGVPDRHKCRRQHGHCYRLEIEIGGKLDEHGMLIEYDELKRIIGPIIALIDHHELNTLHERCSTGVAGLVAQNPTVEHLALWFGERLTGLIASARPGQGLHLVRLKLRETDDAAVVWYP